MTTDDARVEIDVVPAARGVEAHDIARVTVIAGAQRATLETPFTVGVVLGSYGGDEEIHTLEATLLADGERLVLRTVHRVAAYGGGGETVAHHVLDAERFVLLSTAPAAGRVLSAASTRRAQK